MQICVRQTKMLKLIQDFGDKNTLGEPLRIRVMRKIKWGQENQMSRRLRRTVAAPPAASKHSEPGSGTLAVAGTAEAVMVWPSGRL